MTRAYQACRTRGGLALVLTLGLIIKGWSRGQTPGKPVCFSSGSTKIKPKRETKQSGCDVYTVSLRETGKILETVVVPVTRQVNGHH